jgi:hypothetical protein
MTYRLDVPCKFVDSIRVAVTKRVVHVAAVEILEALPTECAPDAETCSVELSRAHWEGVGGALAEFPWKEVNELMVFLIATMEVVMTQQAQVPELAPPCCEEPSETGDCCAN